MSSLWKRFQSYWRHRASVPLYSPEARQDPYPYYKELREHLPAHCLKEPKYWVVSRYDDVRHVLSHPETYRSSGVGQLEESLAGADDPEHARVRKIVSRAFSAEHLTMLESTIRDLTNQFLDDMVERGQCDFVDVFAKPFALKIMATLLDVDPNRWQDYSRWTDALVYHQEVPDPQVRQRMQQEIAEMEAFLENHLRECRDGQHQGVFCTQVIPDLTDAEARDILKVLVAAGNVTTVHLLGNLAVMLLQYPEVMERLRTDRSLIPAAIEETLRLNGPTLSIPRRTDRDVELGGQCIAANSVMFLLLGSANHDENKFPDAERFSLDRNTQGHLAFSAGTHYCIGAPLSRLEAKLVLEILLDRLAVFEAAEPLDQIRWEENMHLRGPERLKVKVRAARQNLM